MSKFTKTQCANFEGLYVVEPTKFGDNRGYFMETYSKKEFEEIGLDYEFVQDNQSRSSKGVLRGLHFQKENVQAKLVRCTEGTVYDVAVDLRPGSKTYGKYYGVILSEDNCKMFMIPRGFAHGFYVLSDFATFCYKVDSDFNPAAEGGVKWDDPDIGIKWPFDSDTKINTSPKDAVWPNLKELRNTDLFKDL